MTGQANSSRNRHQKHRRPSMPHDKNENSPLQGLALAIY